MFRNVVSALNEAQDITLFLMPLAKHFEVSRKLRRCGVFIKLLRYITTKIIAEWHDNDTIFL